MASRVWRRVAPGVALVAAAASGCSSNGGAASSIPGGSPIFPAAHRASPATIGLGATLTTANHGQIFGFDIDQNGGDGVLATAANVETFNEDSGQITKSIPQKTPQGTTYGMDGIFGSDVGLITRYVVPKGSIYAHRYYNVMSPVTKGKFDAKWKPPIPDVDVQQGGNNQSTSTSVLFAIELKNQDKPDLFVTNIAANTVSKVIHLDPNAFGLAYGPQLGQYTSANEAVIAYSPDAGAVGGEAPVNALFNLQTGQETKFSGYNSGPYHAGDVNGLAVDPNTGIAATTTELNAQVEFYDLNKKTGIAAVQLPCTGNTDQTLSGSGVAVDPVNKLFIVSEQYYCSGNQGSALVVYDEQGNLVETITGFTFSIGEPAAVINPGKRMGWTFGPHFDQLQQFFY
jgi:hypothetical protein